MGKFKDLTGQKFGKLTVISFSHKDKNNRACWLCKCDCGNPEMIIVKGSYLSNGSTKSCGCLRKGKARKNLKKINKDRTKYKKYNYKTMPYGNKLHNVFNNMKNRCSNIKDKHYKWYGERGIKVCEEWLDKEKGFINFYNWAIENGYKENLEQLT